MVALPVDGVTRRITRDMDSSKLVDLLRLLSRELRYPLDINVRLDIIVNEDCEELPWEKRPMSSSEQSRFHGTAAQINFFACDRPDFQYASKEPSRKMANT